LSFCFHNSILPFYSCAYNETTWLNDLQKLEKNEYEKNIRKLDCGDGVDFSITNSEGKVTRYFLNRNPKLKSKTTNAIRELEVEISSVETENNDLLHYLFSGARCK